MQDKGEIVKFAVEKFSSNVMLFVLTSVIGQSPRMDRLQTKSLNHKSASFVVVKIYVNKYRIMFWGQNSPRIQNIYNENHQWHHLFSVNT